MMFLKQLFGTYIPSACLNRNTPNPLQCMLHASPHNDPSGLQELSKNAPKAFTKREILSTLLLRHGNVIQLWQELQENVNGATELLGRVKQWYSAVGDPAKQMVYVLP